MSETTSNGSEPRILLDVKGLKTYFFTEDGVVQAVNGVDFAIPEGQVMGLVGESGCGKSVTSLSIMRLLGGSGKIVEGEVWLRDRNLVTLPEDEMVKAEKRVQEKTDEYIKEIDRLLAKKEKDILEI